MRVLVAGGAGCLGSFTAEALVDAGHDVVVVDNLLSGEIENLGAVLDRISFIEADICDKDEYFTAVGKIDVVIHLAFPTPLCTRDLHTQFYGIAGTGTANLLELALGHGAYFIYGSSISVYGIQTYSPIDEIHPTEPILLYGASKLYGEHLTHVFGRTYGLRYASLRYADLYGPRDKRANAINTFLGAAIADRSVEIRGGGRQVRSYTHVRDAARATLLTVERRPHAGTFIVSTDESISINDLALKIKRKLNPGLQIEQVAGPADDRSYVFDIRKFIDTVGQVRWMPLEAGLSELAGLLRSTDKPA